MSVFNEAERRAVDEAKAANEARRPKLTPALKGDLASLIKPAAARIASRRVEQKIKPARRDST